MEFLNAIPMDTSQLFEIGLQWGGTLLSALAVLVFGMWVAKRLTQWATSLLHRKSMDEAAAGFVGQIAYAILVVMVLLLHGPPFPLPILHQTIFGSPLSPSVYNKYVIQSNLIYFNV